MSGFANKRNKKQRGGGGGCFEKNDEEVSAFFSIYERFLQKFD